VPTSNMLMITITQYQIQTSIQDVYDHTFKRNTKELLSIAVIFSKTYTRIKNLPATNLSTYETSNT